ncbi:unnamed protein product, partial [Closterium sp. NIES-54]
RLVLPFLFPELSDFATVTDLMTHLRSLNTRYHVDLKPDFMAENQPPMYFTLYFLTTRLPNSLHTLPPVALPTPPFEGSSPSLLAPTVASAAVVDLLGVEEAGAAPSWRVRVLEVGAMGVVEVAVAVAVAGVVEVAVVGGPEVAVVVEVPGVAGVVEEAVGGRGGARGGGGQGVASGGATGGGGGSGGGQQQQPRREETLLPQQLCEWVAQQGVTGGERHCQYVRHTGPRPNEVCSRVGHTESRFLYRLNDAIRAEFGENTKLPDWLGLLTKGVNEFLLDWDRISAGMYAMYAAVASAEGECYSCVSRSGSVEAASVGACQTASKGAVPAEALHTFTLDSGASRCFFSDCTTVTPLTPPVLVTLANPSSRPIIAHGSNVLPCPAAPSGSLTCLHLPSFATNLVSTAHLQDMMVTTTTPGGKRVSICMDTVTGDHLHTFTLNPWSGLYTLHTVYAQEAMSRQIAASCSCRLLAYLSLLWHYRLGHPSLHRLRRMHSCLLVSGIP